MAALQYVVKFCSDEGKSIHGSQNIIDKTPQYFWQTQTKPSEAVLDICFKRSYLKSIEISKLLFVISFWISNSVVNNGATSISIVAYNRLEDDPNFSLSERNFIGKNECCYHKFMNTPEDVFGAKATKVWNFDTDPSMVNVPGNMDNNYSLRVSSTIIRIPF